PGQGGVLVQAAALAETPAGPAAGSPVRLHDTVSGSWLRVYGRTADADPTVVRAVLQGPAQVVFAEVSGVAGALAIGRAVVTGPWLGLSAVEVVPAHRRRGLGRAVVDALLRWGVARQARWAYLQVAPDNVAALGLYAGYGFTTHHRYCYLRPG
ncbi:MAG: GNAT family N-acetyltransferase, partial [Actinomycetota bacterium]|nr:GNAT family N-acetyltransferase [Actinomycetota bacterium]